MSSLCALEAALLCDDPTSVRPCVAEPQFYSKSKRRRLRDRCVAIRHSQRQSLMVQKCVGLETNTEQAATSPLQAYEGSYRTNSHFWIHDYKFDVMAKQLCDIRFMVESLVSSFQTSHA